MTSNAAPRGMTAPTPATEAPVPTGDDMPRAVSVLVFIRDRGIFLLWAALIAVFAFWAAPYFFTLDNALLVGNAAAITAIFAAGVGFGVMTGVLDLSLPGTAALASCVTGWLITNGQPTWLSLAAGLLLGALVGLVNGLITLAGFNPIIVTIGTLSVLSGLAALVAGGYTFPGLTSLEFMGTHRYLGVPAPIYIVALLFVVGTVFLTRTRDGIRLMAVGGNAEAVRRSGINANRYKVLGFVVSGLCAALGGLVSTAITTEANPEASPGDHLQRADRRRPGRCRPHRWPRQPPARARRRADPGHDHQRPHHPRRAALLGDGRDRAPAHRRPGPGEGHPAQRLRTADEHRQPLRPPEEGLR